MKLPRTHLVSLWLAALAAMAAVVPSAGLPAAEAPRKPVEIKIRPLDPAEAAKVSYALQIKPLLEGKCAECHDADDRKGGFDITSPATMREKGKKAGPGIVAGHPDESAIVEYIRGLREPQMPKAAAPLAEDDLHLIRLWIQAGAADDSATVAAKTAAASPSAGVPQGSGMMDAGTERAVTRLLYSRDNEERLVLGRALRFGLVPKPPGPPAKASSSTNAIDRFIAAKWASAKLPEAAKPPPLCDDSVFIRRVYLDLIGVIPTADEAKLFVRSGEPEKRSRLIDQLLARDEDYAAAWMPFWEEALTSATADSTGGIPSHGNYRKWLRRNLVKNTPYDVMVASLIDPAMPGYQKPTEADANGKTLRIGYVRNETHLDTIQTAANVGQVFLGTGMKCASCHSHFLNKEWPQSRFLAFAGLFAPKDLESIRCEKQSGKFVPAAFPFDLPETPSDAPQTEEDRLHRVALMLVDPTNPRFAKTMVNRLWRRYLGLGLFEPVDDFRLDRPASHPELLEWLAYDFMANGFDLKHSIRLILNSGSYQTAYDPALEDHFDVTKPEQPRYFRSPGLRRVTAEQMIDSIRDFTSGQRAPEKRTYLDKTSTPLTRALGRPASRSEVSTSRPDDTAVVQSLELLNGTDLHSLIYSGAILDRLAEKEIREIPRDLYWSLFSRFPTPGEQQLAEIYLRGNWPAVSPGGNETEEVWVDDELPTGASSVSWEWAAAPAAPVWSGARSHTLSSKHDREEHLFENAREPLKLDGRSKLFTYVYLDPTNAPKEIMLQWKQEGWDHRAYWGEDKIDYGKANTPGRHPMGPLPKTGEWVRLEVPAAELGFDLEKGVGGWAFDQSGGKVYWDKAGVSRHPRNPAAEVVGDMVWAMVVSPEFQYIK
jgi:hypothetical protein